MSDNLIEVKHLSKHFETGSGFFGKKQVLKAVDDISFEIKRGETLGLVGESGCGKSTAGRTILHMLEPTSGQVFYEGTEITKDNLPLYRPKMQMIFQDPYSSLDPRMTTDAIIAEPLIVSGEYKNKAEASGRVADLLETVGLKKEHASRYPHEFSGGQRQRIGIARALAMRPEFLVCDEPVSALDVSVKAQIINTFDDISRELGIAYLFITHDLLTARYISDRIAVMYLGRLVEIGPMEEVISHPAHPYTKILFSTVAIPDPKIMAARNRLPMKGEIPSPMNAPSGCPFRTRCPYASGKCASERPELENVGEGHLAACHIRGEI